MIVNNKETLKQSKKINELKIKIKELQEKNNIIFKEKPDLHEYNSELKQKNDIIKVTLQSKITS